MDQEQTGKLVQAKDLTDIVLLSRHQIQVLVKRGEFPAPIILSERRYAWILGEVNEWLATRPKLKIEKEESNVDAS